MLKIRKCSRTKYGNIYPPVERRFCIKSQPVKCITEKLPKSKKIPYISYQYLREADSKSEFQPGYPDIYIDMDRDENAITTVRRTYSKIKWSQSGKGSRYHKKCIQTNQKTNIPKAKKLKRKTIASEDNSTTNLEKDNYKRYQNDCYYQIIDENTKSHSDMKIPMKPIIISEERKKTYEDNDKLKDICNNIDYDPQSEFVNRLKKGMKKAFDCQCSTCMLDKLEKTLKYTNRRALLEEAYSDNAEKRPYKTVKRGTSPCESRSRSKSPCPNIPRGIPSCIKKNTKCYCNVPICNCDIEKAKKIRDCNYFETRSTEDLKTKYPPHKCVHKFVLDDRLLPKPIKKDSYGLSRCQLCNKTIKLCSPTGGAEIYNDRATALNLSKCYSYKDVSKWNLSEKLLTSKSTDFLSNPCSQISNSNLKLSNKTKIDNLKSSKTKISFTSEKTSPSTGNTYFKPYLGKCLCKMSKTNYLQKCCCNTSKLKLSSGCAKINYDNDNHDTVLELDLQNLHENEQMNSNKFFEKCKKINIKPNVSPYNTLALRYQKGVFNG